MEVRSRGGCAVPWSAAEWREPDGLEGGTRVRVKRMCTKWTKSANPAIEPDPVSSLGVVQDYNARTYPSVVFACWCGRVVLVRVADVAVNCSVNEHARCSTHWLGAYMKFATDALRVMLGRRDWCLDVTILPLRGVGVCLLYTSPSPRD